jgi:hypothetical protein
MDDKPRETLRELIVTYGRSVAEDPKLCEALLRDLCGSHKREINLLVAAAKARVPEDLQAQTGVPTEMLYASLGARLRDELSLNEDAARWAVEAWAAALGISVPRSPKTARGPSDPGQQADNGRRKAAAQSANPQVRKGGKPAPGGLAAISSNNPEVEPKRQTDLAAGGGAPAQPASPPAGAVGNQRNWSAAWLVGVIVVAIVAPRVWPQHETIATSPPEQTATGSQVVPPPPPPSVPTANVTAATVGSVSVTAAPALEILGVTSRDVLIQCSIAITGDASARARVIARFFMSDGQPMPKQMDEYADVESLPGGQAAVWGFAEIQTPPTTAYTNFSLTIPSMALVQGDGLVAVVSVEDQPTQHALAQEQSAPFSNR